MNNQKIKDLEIDNIIAILFIICVLISINGNNKLIEYYKGNNQNQELKNKAIRNYRESIILSVFLYIYFVDRNYKLFQDSIKQNNEVVLSRIRYYGSVFQLFGAGLIAYYFTNSDFPEQSPDI